MHAQHDDIKRLTISLPDISLSFDKPLSEAFVIAVILHCIIFFVIIEWLFHTPYQMPVQSVPLEIIRFGEGTGLGSGGNLTASGIPYKAPPSTEPLEDANKQQQVKQKVQPADQYQPGVKVVATNVSNAKPARDTAAGKGQKNIGARNGSPNGTGIAGTGNGAGSGLGYGVDWGGGGNRIVLNKVLPAYPSGVNKDAQIRIRFDVRPDGSVGGMIPVEKGDPRMEDAAFQALRQWKFNANPNHTDQYGVITFSFKVD